MTPPEFPPNNEASKKGVPDGKNLSPVVSSGATRRRRSLRKQFRETFVAGDARSAIHYVLFDVLLPAAKDMVVDGASQGIEKLIFGDSRKRGSTTPQSGPYGHVNYTRYSSGSGSPSAARAMSRASRARHNFDEIILDQRTEAEEVVDRLFDLISHYEAASIADLYELVGLTSQHTDHKWGWTDLTGAGVTRVRGGYLLDLPEPEPLD